MARRVGIELELLAPPGSSRAALAAAVADEIGGAVTRGWHHDSEPSAHPQFATFRHLTPAFDVADAAGEPYLRIVDDITITDDLERGAPSPDGWQRIISDDARLLHMVAHHLPVTGIDGNAVAAAAEVMGLTWGEKDGTFRLAGPNDAAVALITGVPGDRCRVAECISPPLTNGVDEWLERIVAVATKLGCAVPAEGATHAHYDAAPFRTHEALARLAWAFSDGDIDLIRTRFATNPRCRRIGALPAGLVELVESDEYDALSWDEVATRVRGVEGITKYADVNVLHLVAERPRTDTVEFRMLPSSLDVTELHQLRGDLDRLVDHILNEPGG
ncbi:MAG: amidoligase family protein [Actinomycetota bacterium]